jgi:hypothetical protein
MPWRLKGVDIYLHASLTSARNGNNLSAGKETASRRNIDTEAPNEIFCLYLKSKPGSPALIPISTVYTLSYPTLLLMCLRILYSCEYLGKPATLISISTSFFNSPSTSRFSQTAFTTWFRNKKHPTIQLAYMPSPSLLFI